MYVLLAASVGLSFLQFTNMNSMRNLFIVGMSFFLGLSIPEYFREYTAGALHGPSHTKAEWVNWSFHLQRSLLFRACVGKSVVCIYFHGHSHEKTGRVIRSFYMRFHTNLSLIMMFFIFNILWCSLMISSTPSSSLHRQWHW